MEVGVSFLGRGDPVDGGVVLVEGDPAQIGHVFDGLDGDLRYEEEIINYSLGSHLDNNGKIDAT